MASTYDIQHVFQMSNWHRETHRAAWWVRRSQCASQRRQYLWTGEAVAAVCACQTRRPRFYQDLRARRFRRTIYGRLQNFIQVFLNLTKVCHIKCNHPVNFHFSLYRLYRKEFWWIWPPNSSGLSPLDYHVWSAMHQVFWTQTSLKAQDHSGAKNCTAADLGQLDADNDFVNVWTHAPRPVVDILNIWYELYTEIFWLNS